MIILRRPTHLAQRNRLPDEPGARSAREIFVAPMFWLGHGLAIEFKGQFGMTGREQIRVQVLMTSDAGISPDVKVAQIVHAGADASGIRPIPARMPAQPLAGGPVTVLARDAFIGLRRFR